jgi:hypothetical protein
MVIGSVRRLCSPVVPMEIASLSLLAVFVYEIS